MKEKKRPSWGRHEKPKPSEPRRNANRRIERRVKGLTVTNRKRRVAEFPFVGARERGEKSFVEAESKKG